MSNVVDVRPANQTRPALKLVKTHDLDRQQWLAVRQNGIGSSDAAAAVGLNPYKSPLELWLEKTGRDAQLPKLDPDDDTSPTYWGTLLEPLVAAQYSRRTRNRVRRVNAVLQHPAEPWMLANIDREVIGAADVQILECKTAGLNGAHLWKEGVPEYVQLQVMHQLAVTGKSAADVAVLICGQELQVHRITRDENMIRHLMQLEREFWHCVKDKRPPPADGSESADRALRALYPYDSGSTVDFRGDFEMAAVISDLVEVRAVLEEQGKHEAQLKQRIQERMGDASKALFEAGTVTWKRSKDSTSIDLERLAREHPEIVQTYTVPKAGSRRFLVNV